MSLYNILWIDDQHEKLPTKHRAKTFGINLHPFKSKNLGLIELESNLSFYDGILLDARCFEFEDDLSGTEDTQYSIDALQRINSLSKKFEVFVLTGQSEEFIDGTYKKLFKNVYEKGNDTHFRELMERLVISAKESPDMQIKSKYDSIFMLVNEGVLNKLTLSILLEYAKYLDNEIAINTNELTPLRKVIENLFTYLKNQKLIPEEVGNGNGWINRSKTFLIGQDRNYHYNEEILPQIFSGTLDRLLFILQDGAHFDGSLRLEVDKYLKSTTNDYLFKSAIYGLFDILSWFGTNLSSFKDESKNFAKWQLLDKSEGITGRIIEIRNDFGKFQSNDDLTNCGILPAIMKSYNLRIGQEITITTKPDPKNDRNIHVDKILKS